MSKTLLNEGYSNKNYFLNKGKGSKILNNFIKFDLAQCAGSLLLGHNHNIFKKSIKDVVKKNISNFASPNEYADRYSKKIKETITSCSKIIFCNSGTEAVIKSLRIVKAINKKDKIVNVVGSWHGSVDKLLFKPNKKLKPEFLSAGISDQEKKNLILIPYNDIELSKKILNKNKKNISCILIEPIQASLPTYECKKYLLFLRKFCNKNKIILIFDELITGLRTNGSTVQKYLNIHADISTYGKCYGAGLPIGFISLSKKVVTKLNKNKLKVFFGGTFSGNSIIMYIGNKVFDFIQKNKKKIFFNINNTSKYFQESLNSFYEKNNIDMRIYRFESILRLVFTKNNLNSRIQRDFFEAKKNKKISKFRKFILRNKIHYPSNGIIFFPYNMQKKDINYIIDKFKDGSLKYFNN